MNSEEEFLLKWNNHQNNLAGVLKEWLDDESFIDVTLVCGGEVVPGHKIVLAACSPLLNRIFHDNPCRHPVLILNDVPFTDMKALMSYIYHGEVSVSQRDLSSFLRTAENLQIKGLAEGREKEGQKRKNKGNSFCSNRKRQKQELPDSSPEPLYSDTSNCNQRPSNLPYSNTIKKNIPTYTSPTEETMSSMKDHHSITSSQNGQPSNGNKAQEVDVKVELEDYNIEANIQRNTDTNFYPVSTAEDREEPTRTYNLLSNSTIGTIENYPSSPSATLDPGDEQRDDFQHILESSEELGHSNALSAIEILEDYEDDDGRIEGSPGKFRGGRKPCHFCLKTFCDNYTLRRHMVTHVSRERQFECHLCSAAYSRKDHLMAHIRRKHPVSSLEAEGSKDANQ